MHTEEASNGRMSGTYVRAPCKEQGQPKIQRSKSQVSPVLTPSPYVRRCTLAFTVAESESRMDAIGVSGPTAGTSADAHDLAACLKMARSTS